MSVMAIFRKLTLTQGYDKQIVTPPQVPPRRSVWTRIASAVLILALSYLGLFLPLERLTPFEKTPGFWIADIMFPRGAHYNIGVRGFTALGIDFSFCVLAVCILWSVLPRSWRKSKKGDEERGQ